MVKNLTDSNIFIIPVKPHSENNGSDVQIVYSPFTDEAFLSTSDFIHQMENYLADNTPESSNDVKEIMNALLDGKRKIKLAPRLDSPDKYTKMAILPNHVCNFSCTYCYSAAGRSKTVIDKETLKSAIEHFVDPKRIDQNTNLSISFLGGGEPFLSFDLVKFAVTYASELAKKYGFPKIDHNIVTNGSVLNNEILQFMVDNHMSVSVSFEILKEIQELQRGSYDVVKKNILLFLANDIHPQLRSTITKDNVKLQKQMIEEVIKNYKGVREVMFEYVTDEDSFESIEDIREFLQDYLDNFFIAKEFGEKHGVKVDCSALRNYQLLIERFCPGEYSITPDGEISICSRITSPLNKGYDDCIYGKFGPNGTHDINTEKFEKLTNINVYMHEKCKDCFAKWHCGGGCLAQTYEYSEDILNEMCLFTQNFTKRMILEGIEKDIKQEHGITLNEFLESI